MQFVEGATLLAVMIAGLSGAVAPNGDASRSEASKAGERITILTFNIWVGGENADADKAKSRAWTTRVMRTSQADVICLQESRGNAPSYGEALGYNVFEQSSSTAILTRFAIREATPEKWGVRLELEGGQLIWVFNAHFLHAPYQPYQLASIPYHNGRFIRAESAAVTEARLARGEAAIQCLREMQAPLQAGVPTFLTGDFNEPSHLDWTRAAVDGSVRPLAVEWPTTKLFADGGLADAYRTLHPDPVASPGYTWTPRPSPREVHDRIDFVLYAGRRVRVTDARIIGDKKPQADWVITPYPSDHRAVIATFALPRPPDPDKQ